MTTSPPLSPTSSHLTTPRKRARRNSPPGTRSDLLVPEWRYLQKPSLFPQQQNSSGLMVTEMQRDADLHPRISRVVAVNKMKKVNAVLGFTRLDEMDRRQRPCQPTRQAHPERQAELGARDRGPWRRHLPSTRP
jgi:hypothetical protein